MIPLPIASFGDAPSCATRLLNCFIKPPSPQSIGPVLEGFPGISAYKTVGSGPIRAAHIRHGVKYVVSSNKLYLIAVGGDAVLLGEMSGSARPQIASNSAEVCVLISPRAWVYTIATGVFAEITDTDFTSRNATSVQFIDNFLSFTDSDGQWFTTDLAAATEFDPLNFATAEGSPDHLVGHIVDHRQALLLGVDSCELWDNAGISGFPFVRSSNGFIELGCLVGASAVKVDQSVIWLASDGTIRRLQGVTPVRISTDPLDELIRGYTKTGCFGQTLTWDGHVFYVITFPEATWAYDVNTQQWIELSSQGLDNWRVSCCIEDGGRTYAGDSQSNKFGLLDDVFTEWDDAKIMAWRYPNIYGGNRPTVHDRLEMVFQAGVGLPTGQGSDPEVMLALSDDGGQSFIDMPTRKLGVQGARNARVVWNKLGQSTNRVYEGSISDPVRRKLIDTQAGYRGGRI